MDKNFAFLMELMQIDSLIMPKGILAQKNISENAKWMCSVIITENRFESIEKVKEALASCTNEQIALELGGEVNFRQIKSDLKTISDNLEKIMSPDCA